jgi:hypothetical protein
MGCCQKRKQTTPTLKELTLKGDQADLANIGKIIRTRIQIRSI